LEFLSQDLIRPSPPSEAELRAYFEAHSERYRPPDLITMTHIFLDPDKRGDRTLEDAAAVKVELEALEQPPQDGRDFGDPFMLQSYYPERSQDELAKLFGDEFAQSVFALEPERWHGPVLSGYGVHLVYVHHREEARGADFAAVGERVAQDWLDERREVLNDEFYAGLLARYTVIVDDEPRREDVASVEADGQ
jgi:parvulin-like peptidyl-prolyl isomerase